MKWDGAADCSRLLWRAAVLTDENVKGSVAIGTVDAADATKVQGVPPNPVPDSVITSIQLSAARQCRITDGPFVWFCLFVFSFEGQGPAIARR